MFARLLGKLPGRKTLPRNLRYADARSALAEENASAKRELAARADAPPETLYYLATDADADVRSAVAANPATPRHADILLIEDVNEDVRVELARKIGRLIPDLEEGETAKIRDLTLKALDRLSRDQVPCVRAIIAQEIKVCANAPHAVIARLARDAADDVATPVLEYSPLLSDHDLIELIAAGLASARMEAVARRADLSERVCEEIVARFDIPAVATLLRNRSARIRAETLDRLAEAAEKTAALHEPLTLRADLSIRAVRRIAGFVASELLSRLAERGDLDAETRVLVARRVRARIAQGKSAADRDDAKAAGDLARAAADAGRLDEEAVIAAMKAGQKSVAIAALAELAGVDYDIAETMASNVSPKTVCAIVWRAGLAMRTAFLAQQHLARLPVARRLRPTPDGDYPLGEDELAWQMECFTGEG